MQDTPWKVRKRICPMFIICKAKCCEFIKPSSVLIEYCYCDAAERAEIPCGGDPVKVDLVEIDDE